MLILALFYPPLGGILNNILLAHFSDFPKLPQEGGLWEERVPGTFFLASPVGVFRDAFSIFTKNPFSRGKTHEKSQKTPKLAPRKTDFFAHTPGQPHGPQVSPTVSPTVPRSAPRSPQVVATSVRAFSHPPHFLGV